MGRELITSTQIQCKGSSFLSVRRKCKRILNYDGERKEKLFSVFFSTYHIIYKVNTIYTKTGELQLSVCDDVLP